MAGTPEADRYDAIILGAGQAGPPLARALAAAGRRTALVEREHVGGTCINTGCTPTKTMVASARVAHLAGRAAEYGVQTDKVWVDVAAVRERKRAVVASFRQSSEARLTGVENLELVRGAARFLGPGTVEVALVSGAARRLTAPVIVINTGARPATPSVPGIDAVSVLDSTSIMELSIAPDHLIVLGGGAIGLEFGQMFRRFGSQVTIVHRGTRLLSREDDDMADAIAEILQEDGIDLLLKANVREVARGANGAIRLVARTPNGEHVLTGTHLLTAVGRVPNTGDLNLPAAGVETDERGYVRVDNRLATNVPGIYAAGEVNGGPAFTHIAYDDYRILQANLLAGRTITTDGRLVPYTIFIDPQLGRIGLTETAARQNGYRVRVVRLPMAWIARAIEVDETRGFIKAVVDAETDQILGAAVLGIEGGELMAMLEMAMLGRVPTATIRDAIFAHPTLAESLNTLFSQ